MTREEAKKIVEVLLFVNERPTPIDKIAEVLEDFDKDAVRTMIEELNNEYSTTQRSFSVLEVGGGFQLMTDPFYAPWVRKLHSKEKKQRLSTPALETLSIIAYKQPITKADIEAIRGVNVDGVLDTLLERAIIRTVGRKDVPGRPFLYGTAKSFLMHFGLNSLNDLPHLKEFSEGDIELGKEELIKKEGDQSDEKGVEEVKEPAQEDR